MPYSRTRERRSASSCMAQRSCASPCGRGLTLADERERLVSGRPRSVETRSGNRFRNWPLDAVLVFGRGTRCTDAIEGRAGRVDQGDLRMVRGTDLDAVAPGFHGLRLRFVSCRGLLAVRRGRGDLARLGVHVDNHASHLFLKPTGILFLERAVPKRPGSAPSVQARWVTGQDRGPWFIHSCANLNDRSWRPASMTSVRCDPENGGSS